jgi:hypothetical protein
MGIYDRDYMKSDYRAERRAPVSWLPLLLLGGAVLFVIAAVLLARMSRHENQTDEFGSPVAFEAPIRPLDVNTATYEELDKLPHVTPQMARGIVESRPFESIDDLVRAKGIGPKSLERIRPYLLVVTNAEEKIEEYGQQKSRAYR